MTQSPTLQQLLAVSALLGEAEAIAEDGLISEVREMKLREVIARTIVAFDLPMRAERIEQDNTSEPDWLADNEIVLQEMGRANV
jgi:hypothetical protein